MDDSVELRLVGITYNQIESGVYALILEEPLSRKRLAIVIGYPEAQSIECHMQRIRTPRPLAHDLLSSVLKALGASLLRVDIHRLSSGPYAGKLTVETILGELKVIDARSSDAIALAIRVGAPIFTSRRLLEEKGYSTAGEKEKTIDKRDVSASSGELAMYSDQKLEEMLAQYVMDENYEKAAEIKRELENRRNK